MITEASSIERLIRERAEARDECERLRNALQQARPYVKHVLDGLRAFGSLPAEIRDARATLSSVDAALRV